MGRDESSTTNHSQSDDDQALRDFELGLASEPARAPLEIDPLADDFAGFDAALERAPEPEAPGPPRWPQPWQSLANAAPERARGHDEPRIAPSFTKIGRAGRELELLARLDAVGADVAYSAEKLGGVPEQIAHRADEPFSVVGLERIPLLLEAILKIKQGAMDLAEPLPMPVSHRAISRLGREVPEGRGITVQQALVAACHDDDDTAADALGWRLGWRELQQHLAAFGLAHHTLIVPSRVQALAFTPMAGPLGKLSLDERVERWRSLSEQERRSLVGQIHHGNLDLSLRRLTESFVEVAEDPTIPWTSKVRWAQALAPRGCASEYGTLIANLWRGGALSRSHSEMAVGILRGCAGDHLTGAGHGDYLSFGKLGQTLGALCGAGVVVSPSGGEVALCVLAKNIVTEDVDGLVEELRVLSNLLVTFVLNA